MQLSMQASKLTAVAAIKVRKEEEEERKKGKQKKKKKKKKRKKDDGNSQENEQSPHVWFRKRHTFCILYFPFIPARVSVQRRKGRIFDIFPQKHGGENANANI